MPLHAYRVLGRFFKHVYIALWGNGGSAPVLSLMLNMKGFSLRCCVFAVQKTFLVSVRIRTLEPNAVPASSRREEGARGSSFTDFPW